MVVDDAALDLLLKDEPEPPRVAADSLQELGERSAGRGLSLPAPASRLSPASPVELRVGSSPEYGPVLGNAVLGGD